jgi:hypothetical protein
MAGVVAADRRRRLVHRSPADACRDNDCGEAVTRGVATIGRAARDLKAR